MPAGVYWTLRFTFLYLSETTALSIAFGNQGQKLPLVRSFRIRIRRKLTTTGPAPQRNRHGTSKHGRRSHREGDSEGSESSDDT